MKRLILLMLLLPSVALAQVEGMTCVGVDCFVQPKADGELTLMTPDEDDLNLCTDVTGSVACVTINAADGQLELPAGLQISSADLDADVITMTTAQPLLGLAGSSAVQSHIALVQNVASAVGADLVAAKTRAAAGSTNANTIISSGDDILKIRAFGANGTAYDEAAQILLESGGTPGASADMPGQIRMLVSADGSATPTEGFKLGPTGLVTLANGVTVTAGDAILTNGDLSLVASGKTIEIETGTAASACAGSVTANGVTAVTVSTTCATTGSRIFVSRTSAVAAGVTEPGCWATNIVNGTSFDFDCNDAAEDSTFNWLILHEAP